MYSVGSALPVRLLHISDLHAGSVEGTAVEQHLKPLVAVLVTLLDVIVRDKDPAEEDVPAVLFAKEG